MTRELAQGDARELAQGNARELKGETQGNPHKGTQVNSSEWHWTCVNPAFRMANFTWHSVGLEPTRILVLSTAQYKNKHNSHSQHHTINIAHKRLLR